MMWKLVLWTFVAFLGFGALFFISTVGFLAHVWLREWRHRRWERKRWLMDPVRQAQGKPVRRSPLEHGTPVRALRR